MGRNKSVILNKYPWFIKCFSIILLLFYFILTIILTYFFISLNVLLFTWLRDVPKVKNTGQNVYHTFLHAIVWLSSKPNSLKTSYPIKYVERQDITDICVWFMKIKYSLLANHQFDVVSGQVLKRVYFSQIKVDKKITAGLWKRVLDMCLNMDVTWRLEEVSEKPKRLSR